MKAALRHWTWRQPWLERSCCRGLACIRRPGSRLWTAGNINGCIPLWMRPLFILLRPITTVRRRLAHVARLAPHWRAGLAAACSAARRACRRLGAQSPPQTAATVAGDCTVNDISGNRFYVSDLGRFHIFVIRKLHFPKKCHKYPKNDIERLRHQL